MARILQILDQVNDNFRKEGFMSRSFFKVLLVITLLLGGAALIQAGCSANTEGGAILLSPIEEADTGAGTDTDVDGDGTQCPDCVCNCGDDCCDGGDVICDCDATVTAECECGCCDCCDDGDEPEPEPECGDGEINQAWEECEKHEDCDEAAGEVCVECVCQVVPPPLDCGEDQYGTPYPTCIEAEQDLLQDCILGDLDGEGCCTILLGRGWICENDPSTGDGCCVLPVQ
jgi:hypothetical protein